MKNVYKFRPCPACDAERLESWLTDMAAEGLVLSEDGFFCGFAKFEKTEPRELRYRLDPAPNKPTFFGDYYKPDDEVLELYKEYGWTYSGYTGDYYIYHAPPDARELSTEPETQALAMDKVRRRRRCWLIGMIIEFLIITALNYRVMLVRGLAEVGTLFMLGFIAAVLWSFWRDFRQVRCSSRLYRRLKNGEAAEHNKDWRRGEIKYKLGFFLFTAFLAGMVLWFVILWAVDMKPKESVVSHLDELPYITMKSLADEGSYRTDDAFYASNEYETRKDFLCRSFKTSEHADMRYKDINISGGMYVDYYELRFEGMAKLLMWELRHEKHATKRYKLLEAPAVDADDVFMYLDIFPTVVLRQGDKVIKVSFYQTGNHSIDEEIWVRAAADSIR